MLYRFLRAICVFILKIFFRLEVHGRKNIPQKGGFILASNHVSLLDPIVVGSACSRQLDFMAKDTLFSHLFLGWLLRKISVFPIKQNYHDIGAIKEAIKRLKSGQPIAMFPEGGRRQMDNLTEARPGIGLIAYRTGVPIIPAFVKGTAKALPKGAKFIKPTKIKVTFGSKIFIERRQAYDQVAKEIMQQVGQLQ